MVKSWLNNSSIRKQLLNDIKEELFRREFEKAINENCFYNERKRNKRIRSAFTTEQLNYLEGEFQKYPYVSSDKRKEISEVMNISDKTIKIWFQNRRMREKSRQEQEKLSTGYKEYEVDQRFVKVCTNDKDSTLINMLDMSSVNDQSLPILYTGDESVSKIIDAENDVVNEWKHHSISEASRSVFYKEYSSSKSQEQDQSIFTKATTDRASQSKDRSSSPFLSAEYSIELLKKYSRERNNNVVEQFNDNTEATHEQSPAYPQVANTNQDEKFVLPQDLSCTTKARSPIVVPYKDRYRVGSSLKSTQVSSGLARTYKPFSVQENLLWRPIEVPIRGAPPMVPYNSTLFSGGSYSIKKSCSSRRCKCDCHTSYPSAPLMYQVPNSQVQYVLTAVPMQGYVAPSTSN